ncbi:MAG TPA: phosphonate ABC transporter substrate-binding protein [Acetobacteraceae bacterium]|jgi:phosphonate transport system substrate-binding protein|nr:phosphonate ABC transporter substrate-binding protein [Acetobacteraceae bacterium]
MFTRRRALGLAALGGAAFIGAHGALAEDWRKAYPEIAFAVVPAENEAGVVNRWTPFATYLSQTLGVPVKLRIGNDYAAVIEGQRSGNILIGYYGAASFARALITGVRSEAFALNVNKVSGRGYYSVFYVLASSPYHKIADLKGKNLGLVDVNSTSGYQVPLFALHEMGIDADTYFANSLVTGSHENGIFALVAGTVDVAADSWNSPTYSNLTRMLTKKMLKHPDGTLMTQGDFRIILTSQQIINGPYTYLADLPPAMKADIRAAFFAAPTKVPDAFNRLSDGQNLPWQPVDNAAYDGIVKLIRFVDSLDRTKT